MIRFQCADKCGRQSIAILGIPNRRQRRRTTVKPIPARRRRQLQEPAGFCSLPIPNSFSAHEHPLPGRSRRGKVSWRCKHEGRGRRLMVQSRSWGSTGSRSNVPIGCFKASIPSRLVPNTLNRLFTVSPYFRKAFKNRLSNRAPSRSFDFLFSTSPNSSINRRACPLAEKSGSAQHAQAAPSGCTM